MSTHKAKKHLGQNFLTDQRIQHKIIDACHLSKEDTVLEIGPGQGAVTRLIAPHVQKLICVETDRDLLPGLQQEFDASNVEIVHADFLKWPLSGQPHGTKVIGNIPYYISTPIIERLIECRKSIATAYLTVQLEFGQRLAAGAGSKDYGSLSCFAQYYADVKLLFKIKNTCFKPAPKVDSCFVALDFTRPRKYVPRDEAQLFKLIRTSFTQRRKTFVNAAASVAGKEGLIKALEALKIPANVRPEQLNLQNFVAISNSLV